MTALADELAGMLTRARARTLGLVDALSEADQRAQYSPLMSPPVWDLAHIGNYEELWLLRAIDGRGPIDQQLDYLYNAFEHPRWTRPNLPILGPAQARSYIERVRAEALALLDSTDLDDEPLTGGGFVHAMVVQHEHQHAETLLATRQIMGDAAVPLDGDGPGPGAPAPVDATTPVYHAGGAFEMGTRHPWAYDNERPPHIVEVAPFALDTGPVTNAAYAEFIADGGYERPDLWSAAGWSHKSEAGLVAPQFWSGAAVLRFGRHLERRPEEPVQHVGYYEAEAFARWRGARLPTEAEWEFAATIDTTGSKRTWPWGEAAPTGRANLDQVHDGPAEVGAYPEGVSDWGCHQLIGDVWEWTSSDFAQHPGFASFPYDQYSLVFFGPDHKVLRGGSWGTHHTAARGTFRNWDLPIRRQIFSGFRCVRSL